MQDKLLAANTISGAFAGQANPEKIPPVGRALNELAESVSLIELRIEGLGMRLGPVLAPQPECGKDRTSAPSLSQIEGAIRDQSCRAFRAAEQLEELISRLTI